jgi:phage tail sheath protein FI
MAKVLATPGVYIEEKSAFSSSVVPVSTAVPAFIGYTQRATRGNKPLTNVPTRVTSLAEFEEMFGGAPKTKFTIQPEANVGYTLSADQATRYLLHSCLRHFYSNGGGDCYVVSIGNYGNGIKAIDFNDPANGKGLVTLLKFMEPTLLVIPEAVLLEESDCSALQQAMLLHCGYTMKNRFAILDVFNGDKERTFDDEDVINKFREGVGANFLQWGAAYYPFLKTTVVQSTDVDFTNISNKDGLIEILTKEVVDGVAADLIRESRAEQVKAEIAKIATASTAVEILLLSDTLKVISSTFKSILSDMREILNVLPPSAAMAGVYAMVDNSINIAKSPANVSIGNVISPVVSITNESQEELNLPLTGKAINAIRAFTGKGTIVWGARTLDGNSQDWRYISVRRTMTFLEQSIKIASERYVFEPNTATTWISIKATIENFLNNQWQGGLLAGSTPTDAFSVEIGLGSTMTANDILDGMLKLTVKVAIVRPAEFIVITFQQQQQKS